MKAEELRQICWSRHITFIPHHDCSLCGEYVGWYLFFYPNEVVFTADCGCGSSYSYQEDSWSNIIDWITDNEGNLLDEYKWIEEGKL